MRGKGTESLPARTKSTERTILEDNDMRPAKTTSLVAFLLLAVAMMPASLKAQQIPPASGNEAQLIAVLKSNGPEFEKMKACQQLAVTGTKECVPVLAGMLGDEKMSHYARFGLEPIPDPSVDEALRAAMGKLKGGLLVGVINSVAMRRDVKAVGKLAELLANEDKQVAASAAAALGRIHTEDAMEALVEAYGNSEALRPAIAAAGLTAADMLVKEGKKDEALRIFDAVKDADVPNRYKLAALQGGIVARGAEGVEGMIECLGASDAAEFAVGLATAQKLPGAEVNKALVAQLGKLVEAAKKGAKEGQTAGNRATLVVYVLGARGDKAAMPTVLDLAKGGPEALRLPAVRVLAELGDASCVPVLLEAAGATSAELADAARNSLAELPGKEIDEALTAALGQSKGKQLSAVIELIGLRGITSALPEIQKLANSEDPEVRKAAVAALGLTVGLGELPALIERMVTAKTPEAATAAKETLRKACQRMPNRDECAAKLIAPMASASVPAQCNLMDLLGVVGGEKALGAVSQAAKEGSGQAQDAATRVLGEWMSPDAAPVLLEMAKTGPERYRIRALRGYIRIARQLNLPAAEKLAMCRTAMEVAGRKEEQRLVLEVLGRNPSVESMAMVTGKLESADLKDAAAAAAVKIGQKLWKSQPGVVAEAMPKVIEATSNKDVAAAAKMLLEQAKK